MIGAFELGVRDVGGKLDDPEWNTIRVEQGVVDALDPDPLAGLADAGKLCREEFARAQLTLELAQERLFASCGSTNMR